MSQTRTVQYHALDTSALHNRQLAGVVRPGVYRGFKLRANAADTNRLDVTHGADASSVLVTAEGVRIEEDAEILGAVAVDNADPNLTRVDLIVAEYRFTTNNQVEMAYRAVRGKYAAAGATPVPPAVESEYQIPLAQVTVRAQAAYGGSGRARIATEDVVHVGRAAEVRAPLDVSSLMPIVEPSDRRRVFVHAGLLPSFDGTAKIEFPGGYSDVIDPETLAPNAVRYYLFGVSDDKQVVLIGDAATEAELPAFTRDVFPVCSVKAKNIDDKVLFLELTDLRFPFARQLSPVLEEEVYKATLAGSVFKHVRVDLFRDLTGVAADSVSAGVAVAADRGTTALKFTADETPTDDVYVATKNVLRDTSINLVEHFMVVAETDFDGLEIQFSTTGSYSGFVSARVRPNTIVRVPSGGAARLYLRFIVPAAAFADGKTPQIFSYGCFMVVDEGVLNANTLSDVGVAELKNAVPNLIANGNFRYWSRDDVNGNPTDPDAAAEIAYPVSDDERFAADGWQFVELGFEAANGQVKRVGLSADVLGAEIDNAADTALEWRGAGGTGGAVNVLEYRVPLPAGALGRRLTFAVSYRANSIAAVGVGIVFYERTPQRTLRVQGAVARTAAAVTSGELLVQSDAAAGESTYCVGFRVYLTQTAGESRVWLWGARAAVGEFRTLPYNEAANATDVLRKYYERGRLYAAQNAAEGDVVGASIQFGAKKFVGLGTLEAQVVPFPDSNRSVNTADPSFETTADGLVATAPAVSAGPVRIDLDFEAFVRYAAAL